ncbi:hypothetical protein DPX16_19701 [Anabarilius grahami]|uniref:Uncharacterized protein n=1 Tax=Anabarilius grahami TaxID=495550 RepID=A0A3N0XRQ1_ANAGA|nr:hypothetical protein DPX16_19701 [Anabarilius grahami]
MDCASSLCAFGSVGVQLPSGFALVLSPTSFASVLWHPGSISDVHHCGFTSASRSINVTWSHHLFGSASVNHLPGSVQPIHQGSAMAPPSIKRERREGGGTLSSLSSLFSAVVGLWCQPFELCMSPSPQCSSITPGAMTEWRTEGGHSPHRYSSADKCQRSSLEDRAFRALNLPQRK